MNVTEKQVIALYKDASEDSKKLLEIIFGEEMFKPKDVTDRIKTFEDACDELGKNHKFVLQYRTLKYTDVCDCKDISAYLKLRIICAALNEGWEPQFTENEDRYYPWFVLYTQKEINKMSKEERSKLVLWGVGTNSEAYRGLATVGSYSAWSHSPAHFGSRLVLKNKNLAEYCGRHFINLWKDLYI